ncbi:MAG: ABC transporter ATP-binding protein [Candidatus Cloacimonetes bacterium]|nr:ABC transporter ATP-binding protein [Candidatus Cloacimonadota bacterium]
MENNIRAAGISKSFGSQVALQELDFAAAPGEIFGFIGADGAGKTTLFKILTTLLRQDAGKAEVCGLDTDKDFREIRRIIGYMAGRFSLYGDLSVEENLKFFAQVFDSTLQENYELIRDIYVLLEPFKKRRAADLSGGMKQKLALCCALIHKPKVLVLDEPTTGVDPVSRREFWDNLKTVAAEGITTLVATPYMDEAMQCDRVALLQEGRILQIDRPAQIIADFPKAVIILKTEHNRNQLIRKLRKLPEAESVFSFGETIHVTCEPAIKGKLTAAIAAAESGISFQPEQAAGIEDCFLYYMQRADGRENN